MNFENTVIIMTSNAGSDRKEASLGFAKTAEDISREKALTALGDFLRPEFLSRIDEVIVFRPLDVEDYKKIAALMLEEYVGSLKEKGIALTYDQAACAPAGGEVHPRQKRCQRLAQQHPPDGGGTASPASWWSGARAPSPA